MKIFNLPDLGEGLPDAEIHAWHVKEGDDVAVDQLLLSVETAKAVVDVPSPYQGKIVKLYASVGDIVPTGGPLVAFSNEPVADATENQAKKEPLLTQDKGTVAGSIQVGDTVIEENATGIERKRATSHVTHANHQAILPAVRMMARQLGVNLETLQGTGTNDSITLEDVKNAASIAVSTPLTTVKKEPPPGYAQLRGVRRTMAQAMTQSNREVVPVTLFDDANLHYWEGKQDITVRIIRALVKACELEPALNAWFDTPSMSRKLIEEVNIGLALDSGDGLFVPVIHNAQTMNAKQLRETIDRFKKQVGDRSIPKEDLQGATIMLSNFGMFAGRYATPIITPPLVAILGCGKLHEAIAVINGKPEVCRVFPLSLSFDHRAITGGEATRFLAAFITDFQKSR